MPPSINKASKVANTTGINTTGGDILSANAERRWFLIQNLGTNALFVKLGAGASTSDFNIVLKAGSVADDGLGGSYESSIVVFSGIISATGTNPRFVATEI